MLIKKSMKIKTELWRINSNNKIYNYDMLNQNVKTKNLNDEKSVRIVRYKNNC